MRIGLSNAGSVMTYQDIHAWRELTGVDLDMWEVETIRSMSSVYLVALQKYEDKENRNMDPPFMTEVTHQYRSDLYIKNRREQVELINAKFEAKKNANLTDQ